jgi:ABC-type dipeptide/oligopeptide/nickel transport system permease component
VRTYIIKRLLLAFPTILGAVTLVFFAIHLAPGDPAALFIPPDLPSNQTDEAYARIRAQYGFDQPIPVQYVRYLQRVAQLDFGQSLRQKTNVMSDLLERIPNTLQLGLVALGLSVVIGVSLGVLSAVNRGSWLDNATMLGALFGVSMPSFWFALMLILLFAVTIPILPPSGFDGPIYTWQGFSHLILPALVLGLGGAGGLARYTRSSMLEVINNDYVRTARAKGLHSANVIVRHALRNALIPVVTILGLSFGQILSGTVIVETVFAWPGIGRYLVSAISGRDFPAVQASVLLVAISFVFANLATDLMLVYVDPRIRYE